MALVSLSAISSSKNIFSYIFLSKEDLEFSRMSLTAGKLFKDTPKASKSLGEGEPKAILEVNLSISRIPLNASDRLLLILVLFINSSTLSSLELIALLSRSGCSSHLLRHLAPILVLVLSSTHKSVALLDVSRVFSQISRFLLQLPSMIKYLLFWTYLIDEICASERFCVSLT